MALFVLFQWGIIGNKESGRIVFERIGLWFAISCVLNAVWIILWHTDHIGASTLTIIALLVTLIIIDYRLKLLPMNKSRTWFCDIGFVIYYGWIIAATIANITVWLVSINWNGFELPTTFWTLCVLLVGAVIGIALLFIARNPIATASIVWAYIGIMIKHISTNGFAAKYPLIIITLAVSMCTMCALIIISLLPLGEKTFLNSRYKA